MKLLQHYTSVFAFIFFLSVFCIGQEKLHKVGKEFQYDKYKVLDLVELKTKDGISKQDEWVLGDKDWLKNLTVRVRNVSNTAICFARIDLVIPPVGKMKFPLQVSMKYGLSINRMKFIDKEAVKNYADKIQPGDSFEVSFDDFTKRFLDNFIKQNQIDEIDSANVRFDSVIFEDSRIWSLGHEMEEDAKNPAQWNVIGSWFDDKNKIRKKIDAFIPQ
jgi:hypothetical protein